MGVLDLGPIIGPQGPQGNIGPQGQQGVQGNPGPNQVTTATESTITGLLKGVGGKVAAAVPGVDFSYGIGGNNLLDNGEFWNPVNQRGLSSYGAGYCIDRWISNGYSGNVDVVAAWGLRIPYNTMVYQKLAPYLNNYLQGKTITLSVQYEDLTYASVTALYDFSTLQTATTTHGAFQFGYHSAYTYGIIGYVSTDATKIVTRIKAELGPVSTLAYDPPADYGKQMEICQRYYKRLKNVPVILGSVVQNSAYQSNAVQFGDMRITPTVILGALGGNYGVVQGKAYVSTAPNIGTTENSFSIYVDATTYAAWAGCQVVLYDINIYADL